jgi:hypothetical protein
MLSKAEQQRSEDISQIQTLLSQGYTPTLIKDMLHTTYNRIRRYATGDPLELCRFTGERESNASHYKNEIVNLLKQNVSLKEALIHISELGYMGKRSAFEAYCRKVITDVGISYMSRRSTGIPVSPNIAKPACRYVSRRDFLHYLWSSKDVKPSDADFIFRKYPQAIKIQQCILEFRKIYDEKDVILVEQFIEQYSQNISKSICSFASGLRIDLEAVKNSVVSQLSNGFVEGINNKIKAIKRTMFGRAKIDLLRVKVIFAR